MLLNSITGAFAYFKNPWVGIFCLCLVLAYFTFLMTIRLATATAEDQDAAGPGCLTQFLGLFIQAFIIAAFILLLLPILLRVDSGVSLQAVEPLGFVAIRSGLLAMIFVTVVTFFPWIGTFLAASPGMESFLIATLAFRFLSPLYLEALIGPGTQLQALYPSWGVSLIYLILALVFTRMLLIFFTLVSRRTGSKDWVLQRIGPSVDILGGILPFFMYAHYTAQNVQAVLSG